MILRIKNSTNWMYSYLLFFDKSQKETFLFANITFLTNLIRFLMKYFIFNLVFTFITFVVFDIFFIFFDANTIIVDTYFTLNTFCNILS